MGKINIIGGGITGCATALALADNGHDVTIYEMAAQLGGSLRDFRPGGSDGPDGVWGFRACQYLNPSEPWLRDILSDLECEMQTFDHLYGSYTVFEEHAVFRDDMALPVLPVDTAPLRPYQAPPRSLADRFTAYPPPITDFLSQTVARCGHAPEALSTDCASALQLPAVNIAGDTAHLLAAKAADPLTDSLIALPRSAFGTDYAHIEAALPTLGYDAFFDALTALLKRRNVKLALSTPTAARRYNADPTTYGAYVNGDWLTGDLTVWCCNPVPLMLMSGLGRLSNPASRFVHLHMALSGLTLTAPRYVQVFDPGSPLYRLYAYPSQHGPRLCLEMYAQAEQDTATACAQAQKILAHLWPNVCLGPCQRDAVTAHYLYSDADSALFDALEASLYKQRIIPGAWRVFGRDPKINSIHQSLAQTGALPAL